MRHRKKFNHLGRKTAHRHAMLANMACSLIVHKRIQTTVAKAKALRMYVEPIITKSKDDSTHSRRMVFSYLKDKEAVTELFREVAGKIDQRPGGYTRIIKTGNRLGDNAEMCIMELVDFNENLLGAKAEAATKNAKRSRRGGSKSDAAATKSVKEKPVAKTPVVEEQVKEELPVVEEQVVEEQSEVEEQTEEVLEMEDSEDTTEENMDSEEEKSEENK